MEILLIVLPVLFFILLFWCMKKEKELVGVYKATKTFGRIYAAIAVDLLFGGICAPIASIIIMLISEENGIMSVPAVLGVIVAGAAVTALGVFMYKRAYKKCPEALKSRCYKDLTIIGFGAIIRVSLFVMMFVFKTWWEFSKPEVYTLSDGTEVYVYNDGTVYDSSFSRSGKFDRENGQEVVVWNN